MGFDPQLLEIIACPCCQAKLTLSKDDETLICYACELKFPIQEGIPVLMEIHAEKFEKQDNP